MTALHLLALAGYFLCLYEYIAMRHRDICAESDARIGRMNNLQNFYVTGIVDIDALDDAILAQKLYWNRGTK